MELALKAAAITGADIAGIDLLYDRDGRCFVIEVNAVPGWMAFGRANKIDVSARFLRYLMG
jgi:ribosomal protein S6--L-glutamate ligase